MRTPRTRHLTGALLLLLLPACQGSGSGQARTPQGDGARYPLDPFYGEDLRDPLNPLALVLDEPDFGGGSAALTGGGVGADGRQLVGAGGGGRSVQVELKDGSRFDAYLLSLDGESLQLRTADGARVVGYDEVEPRNLYTLLRLGTSESDPEGQLAVGDYATSQGLWAYAARHYKRAARAGGDYVERADAALASLRHTAAEGEFQRAVELHEAGRTQEALDVLERLVDELPDEAASQRAGEILDQVDARREAQRAERRAARSPSVDQALAKAHEFQSKAEQAVGDGLRNAGKPSRAIRSFERGLDQAGRGRKAAQDAARQRDASSELVRAAQELDGELVDLMVDTDLHLASIYLVRTSHNKAMAQVNDALALRPGDRQALEMRARIEEAANQPIWYGWYLPGRYPVLPPVETAPNH